jgi:multicomponent Na+:H+ antiporter subunit B
VYGTRGYDTFGETFLLLAAVVSVVLLTRAKEPRRGFIGEERAGAREQRSEDSHHGPATSQEQRARIAESHEEAARRSQSTPDEEPIGRLGPETAETMSVVARTASRIAAPVLAIAGCYLCAWGYTPGGGFPAGVVVLGVILLIYAGFGYSKISRVIRPGLVETAEMAGALLIVATEVLGLLLKGSVSANYLPLAPIETIRAGGVLQVFSGGELIEVATGLTLAVFAILGMRHDWAGDVPEDS